MSLTVGELLVARVLELFVRVATGESEDGDKEWQGRR